MCRGDGRERVLLVLQPREILVNVAHECVEVDARLALYRDGGEERVHQEALAAADAAPQIDAARNVGRREDLLERRLARGAKRLELGGELLQALERRHLRVIEHRAARCEDRIDPRNERARAAADLAVCVGVVHLETAPPSTD
jgi:hypothetical protein